MKSSLVSNISSEYIEAAGAMHKQNRILVYVEGYEDVAFWRNIFDHYQTPERIFEIMTPARSDLAKGKKVVLGFRDKAGPNLLLCVDSDFDFLFGDMTDQSRLVNSTPYLFQTYVYAIENYMCYSGSLATLAVRATKNDARIFDFEQFMSRYSRIVYPLFLWYAYAAMVNEPSIFTLSDYRNAVRINYLNIEDNGSDTLAWLERQVNKRINYLKNRSAAIEPKVMELDRLFRAKGLDPEQTYLYMQGHTLLEHVVKVVLNSVCEELRKITVSRIMNSSREGLSLKNELSYYNNSLREVDSLLSENTLYSGCDLFSRLRSDIERVLNLDS